MVATEAADATTRDSVASEVRFLLFLHRFRRVLYRFLLFFTVFCRFSTVFYAKNGGFDSRPGLTELARR